MQEAGPIAKEFLNRGRDGSGEGAAASEITYLIQGNERKGFARGFGCHAICEREIFEEESIADIVVVWDIDAYPKRTATERKTKALHHKS